MERWSGCIAVVTGASSGIGSVVAVDLAKAGLIVIGLARRVELVDDLCKKLTGAKGKLIGHYCDVTDKESVKKAFDWIESNYGGVNILVTNAGILKRTKILDDDNDASLDAVIDTNAKGLVYSIKAAYRHMKKYDSYGHIINVNSIFGHSTNSISEEPLMNVYNGSKFFVTATTEILRRELIFLKNLKVRISSISPGLVDTDIFETGNIDPTPIRQGPILQAADISQSILFMLSVPEHVQIHELMIKPVGELY